MLTRRQRIIGALGIVSSTLFVAAGTFVLVLIAKGYDFDLRTHEIVQNGLILIGSEPVPAQITMDDLPLETDTPHRMNLAPGTHTMKLTHPDYRDWQRTFELLPGEVLWLSYPLLIPKEIVTRSLLSLGDGFVNEPSPDGSRLAIGQGQSVRLIRTDRVDEPSIVIEITTLVAGLPGRVTELTWSDNNSRILAKISDGSTTNYLLLTTGNNPSASNVSALLAPYSDARFVPRENEDFIGLRDGGLWRFDIDPATADERITETADRYEVFDNVVISWAKSSKRVVLHEGDRSTVLNLPAVETLTDMTVSRYRGRLFVAVSSPEHGTFILLQPGKTEEELITTDQQSTELLPSVNGNYLLAYTNVDGQVYDLETKRFYDLALPGNTLTTVRWATGSQIMGIVDGQQLSIFDFDGSNFQVLADTADGLTLLSPNKENAFHITAAPANGAPLLSVTELLVGN